MSNRLDGNTTIIGNLVVTGTKPEYSRSELAAESGVFHPIPWTAWRVWDAFHTNLPGTSATDDLALIGGTFGSASPSLRTYDVKSAGAVTLYARCSFQLPPEYEAGEAVSIRCKAGMITTVAGTSATVDFEAYLSDGESGIGSDLVSTAAQSINSLTHADKTFTVTATTLEPGGVLDIRVTVAVNDGAGVAAVIAALGEIGLLLNIRG